MRVLRWLVALLGVIFGLGLLGTGMSLWFLLTRGLSFVIHTKEADLPISTGPLARFGAMGWGDCATLAAAAAMGALGVGMVVMSSWWGFRGRPAAAGRRGP